MNDNFSYLSPEEWLEEEIKHFQKKTSKILSLRETIQQNRNSKGYIY